MKMSLIAKTVLLVLGLVAGGQVHADGFKCRTLKADLNIRVYHHTHAKAGTKNAAVMVFSDPTLSQGNHTIARFTDSKSTLSNVAATYVAEVDAMNASTPTLGDYLGGIALSQLDQIVLDIDFSYSHPVENGDDLEGVLTLVKRSGDTVVQKVSCARYLKN